MEDVTCLDCSLLSRRLKELEDKNTDWQEDLENSRDAYDLKCDQLRESLITNARLRLLLHEKGTLHDY